MSKNKQRKFRARHAIMILLFITIGASVAAFLWINSIETHVVSKQLYIDAVTYNSGTKDMNIRVINGLTVDVPIEEDSSPDEMTVFTMYPTTGEGIDCDFVPLGELACEGTCNGSIKSGKDADITLSGRRIKCLLEKQKDYYLNIFFGLRTPISKEFKVE